MSTPYTCPICKGKQTVRRGFYADYPIILEPVPDPKTGRQRCRGCLGQGILWDHTTIQWTPNQYPNQYGNNLTQCGNCKQWYQFGSGHSCVMSFSPDAPTTTAPFTGVYHDAYGEPHYGTDGGISGT